MVHQATKLSNHVSYTLGINSTAGQEEHCWEAGENWPNGAECIGINWTDSVQPEPRCNAFQKNCTYWTWTGWLFCKCTALGLCRTKSPSALSLLRKGDWRITHRAWPWLSCWTKAFLEHRAGCKLDWPATCPRSGSLRKEGQTPKDFSQALKGSRWETELTMRLWL